MRPNKIYAALLTTLLLGCPVFAQQPVQRPKILGISHAGYFVSDLPKALDFWHGLLGYDEPYDLKNPDGTIRIAFIKINDHQHIELFNEYPPAGSGYLSHIAFLVSNADQMRLYLNAHGIPAGNSVGKGKTGDRNFEIKDPDGTLVEFVESQPDGMERSNAGKFLPATRISDAIYHLGFLVGSSEKAIHFYGDILGFQEFWRGSSNGKELSWIDMRVPDGKDYVEFMLYRDLPAPNGRGVSEHVSLVVPNLDAAITTLESRRLQGLRQAPGLPYRRQRPASGQPLRPRRHPRRTHGTLHRQRQARPTLHRTAAALISRGTIETTPVSTERFLA